MAGQAASNRRFPGTPEAVVPLALSMKSEPPVSADQLDIVGQNALALVHRAADISDEEYNRAVDIAHKLADQLEDAKERIRNLEADVTHYQKRTDCAEKWLAQIATEIEQRFFRKSNNGPPHAPPAGPRTI
jgi:hypothetical protein